jgi:putative membrane protein
MVIQPAITPEDHARLTREIRAVEAKTSAEIYVVVAHSADDFRLVPFLWGAVFALVLPWCLWFATSLSFGWMLSLQVLGFAVVSGTLSVPSLRYRVVPGGLAKDAAHRAALAQFMAHGVHLDSSRTAILLYVCMLPRHIEVLADQAIHTRLNASHWQKLVELIATEARSGRLADGLAAAIRSAGEVLAKDFPSAGARRHIGTNIVET